MRAMSKWEKGVFFEVWGMDAEYLYTPLLVKHLAAL
jgi:hypothetical protein